MEAKGREGGRNIEFLLGFISEHEFTVRGIDGTKHKQGKQLLDPGFMSGLALTEVIRCVLQW